MRFSSKRLAVAGSALREPERSHGRGCGFHGSRGRRFSCTGGVWAAPGIVGAGSVSTSFSACQNSPIVFGSVGGNVVGLPFENPSAEVRSPNVCRRQSVMFVSRTPVKRSRNWSTEVWSNCSVAT